MRAAIFEALPATRHREFRALWGGTASSSISLWTLLLGNAYIVFKLSDSSFWVAVTTFASMSPFVLAPLGGIVADRFERRILVQVTRAGAFVVTFTLFLLAYTGVLEVWMVIALALAQGMLRAVELPSDQALIANVVPPVDRANAVTLNTMTQQGSRAIGPLLSSPLLAWRGVEGPYLLAAVFALLALTSVRRLRVDSRGGVARLGDILQNLAGGVNYVRHTRPVLMVVLLTMAHCGLTMSFDAMLPGFAKHQLHSSSIGFTAMNAGVGVGALFGTAWLALAAPKERGRIYLLCGVVSGLSPILMAASQDVPLALVSTVLMGGSQAMFMALSGVLLQEVVPDAVRGRVMSFYLMSAGGLMAFANFGFGSLSDVWDAPLLFLIPGATFTALILTTIVLGSNLRKVYRTGVVTVPAAT